MHSQKKTANTKGIFILPLFVIAFLVQADYLIMVPLSMKVANSTGVSLTHTGLLISIYPIAAAVSAFFFAPFSDRIGRKKMLTYLIIGFCFSSLGCAFSYSTEHIFLFRILSGVFGGIIIPNALAFVSDTFEGKQKIRSLSTLILSFPVASVLGVPLGAWVGDAFSWRTPFIFIAIVSLIVGLFILKLPTIKGYQEDNIYEQYRELLALWYDNKNRSVFAVQFLMLIGLFGFIPQISTWLTLNFQMSTTEIGFCFMQGGIGAILGNITARHLLQRGHDTSLISMGSFVMAVTLLLVTMELLRPSLIGLGFAFCMFGGALRMPAHQVILSDLVSIKLRGRLLSMNMIVANISMGLGGIWSYPLLSVESGLLVGMEQIGWVSFITLCFIPILIHRTKKSP